MVKHILRLGNPRLYDPSINVLREELEELKLTINDLHDTLIDFRQKYGKGRAIAAPQIGIFKRLIYMFIDNPVIFINPVIEYDCREEIILIDDCMSFPELLVKVKRFKKCKIKYKDINWQDCVMDLDGSLSELLQHECDHLDGILATMRAIDNQSFYLK